MKPFRDHPLLLLLTTGLLLGFYFPVGRLSADAGIDPLLWALLISLGPGLLLSIASLASDRSMLRVGHLAFALVSGLLAYVVPNALTFGALPHVGSGYMSLMFAFSPVVTAALSMLVGVRPPNGRLLAGVGLGFAGAVFIALSRFGLPADANGQWHWLAFLVPLSLGIGNVFRTAFWPAGMAPLRMAAVTNLVASLPLIVLLILWGRDGAVATALHSPLILLLQVAISAAMFTVFFRLQWVGGPTYLSQIGYVAAAVGLLCGVVFLQELYPPLVWAGAATIAAGVVVSNWPSRRRNSGF
ncbi:MAG: DMT family transporter [Rhizobiales bacterium]|nr:DMT family transporter [Hyphomicrobiales bacterium]